MLDPEKLKQLRPHKEFYIRGADLHLMAAHTLFRVHSYFFLRESAKFRGELIQPASPGKIAQGFSDATALVIDVSPEDFAIFLKVFYNPKYSLYDTMTKENWTCILNLAHKWQFPEVKNLATRELQKIQLNVVQRTALYQKFEVDPTYLLPLYAELCSRDETPTFEEVEALGMKTSVLIFRGREHLRAQSEEEGKSPLPSGINFDDILDTLRDLLQAEYFSPTGRSPGSHTNSKASSSSAA